MDSVLPGLTEREMQVLRAVTGLRVADVAVERGTSPKTVETQLGSAYRKLGVRTRAAAALQCMELGLV